MPLVGKKHFPYTVKGMQDALNHAIKTGQKVKVDKQGMKKMMEGGSVDDLKQISKELKKASKMHASQAKRVKKHADSMSKGGLLKGPSHKEGGILTQVGNKPIEMEGGEYVIKKSSADALGKETLDYINKKGALPKMMQGGKVDPKVQNLFKLMKKK